MPRHSSAWSCVERKEGCRSDAVPPRPAPVSGDPATRTVARRGAVARGVRMGPAHLVRRLLPACPNELGGTGRGIALVDARDLLGHGDAATVPDLGRRGGVQREWLLHTSCEPAGSEVFEELEIAGLGRVQRLTKAFGFRNVMGPSSVEPTSVGCSSLCRSLLAKDNANRNAITNCRVKRTDSEP